MDTYLVLHELLGVNTDKVHPYLMVSAERMGEASAHHGASFHECWYDAATGFLMCRWQADDEADIRAVLKAAEIPVSSVHRVMHFTVDQMRALLERAEHEG